jgi:hypothetical protein
MRVRTSDRNSGQATVLLLAVVAVVVVLMVATAHFAGRVVTREQAQIAADAAALAGTDGGQPAAVKLARANGGVLVSFIVVGEAVQVVVRVGDAAATARATRAP